MPGERRPKGNTEVPPFTQDEGVKRMREAHSAFLRARETAHKELEREEKQTGKFKRPALIAALKEEVKRLDTLKKDMDWYVSSPVAWTSLGTPTFRVKRETPRKKGVLEQAGRVVGKALVNERPTNVLGEKIGEDPGTTRLMTREEFNTFIARVENEAAFRNPITHADKEMIAVARPKGVWKPEKDEKPKKEERVKKPGKVIEVQTTAPVPERGRGRLKREVTPAYAEPQVEAPLPTPKPARERIPEKDLQQLSEEEYAFDARVQTVAERLVRYGGKPDKERKMFFKALDKRMRILPIEALATFKELHDRFVLGEDVTESELIFAAMDHFRAKYSGVAESEVEQEMVYMATRTVVNQAIKDRAAAQGSQTKRPHVGDDYQRGYTIKPPKGTPEQKEQKKPRRNWFRSTFGAFIAMIAANAAYQATTTTTAPERPAVTDQSGGRTASTGEGLVETFGFNREPVAVEYAADPNYDDELQNPSTNQPYPAEEGYAPAPRVSATEAANDASGETTVTPYTVPEPIDPSAEAGQ